MASITLTHKHHVVKTERSSVTIVHKIYPKFDSVSHKKLRSKLYLFGIRCNLLLWLEHYFCNWSHQTRVGDSLSSDTSLVSGIIQGSGVGPVAFLIYIDDQAKLLESYGVVVKLFADDVKVYLQLAGAGDVTKLQYALDLITQWADEWQLGLSIAKCNACTCVHW